MAKKPPQTPELDERLSRLGREWFAEARMRSAADDEEVKRFSRERAKCRSGSDGWGDLSDDDADCSGD